MKKILSILLLSLLLFACTDVFAQTAISVELNANELEFDVPPVNVEDRILVPVRAIFEAMGADVSWDETTKTVSSTLGDVAVSMTIDGTVITVNGKEKTLDVPPKIISDRTMVPVRAVSESFGANVSWDAPNNCVKIFTQDFLSRTEKMKTHRSTKELVCNETKAKSDFSVSYFDEPEYDVRINANDGTDFEIEVIAESEIPFYASLSIRADIYTGAPFPMTDEYAQSMAESTAQVVAGTSVYGKITTIGTEKFIEMHYFRPMSVHNVDDPYAEAIIYTTAKNGVVYTVTYTHYGIVPEEIDADISHIINTLVIH